MPKSKSSLFILCLALVTVCSFVVAVETASGPVSGENFWRLWE